MSKILVTGANGLMGSHMVEKFVSQGHTVKCLVHRNLDWIKDLEVEIIKGDIKLPETLPKAVKDVDYILHTAALLRAVRKEDYYMVNRDGTRNLIEAAHKYNPGLKKFVYISTQAVMGPSCRNNIKKISSPCTPISDYGKSKLAGEEEVLKFKDKLPVVILRPSAVYGPRDRDLLPFFRSAEKGFFPILAGGGCLIQLLFIKDLVNICCIVMDKDKTDDLVYFVSEKTPYKWKEISSIFSNTMHKRVLNVYVPKPLVKSAAFLAEKYMHLIRGKPAAFNFQKAREICQRYWIGDSEEFINEFKYIFTPLDIGLKITYDWYKENNWL